MAAGIAVRGLVYAGAFVANGCINKMKDGTKEEEMDTTITSQTIQAAIKAGTTSTTASGITSAQVDPWSKSPLPVETATLKGYYPKNDVNIHGIYIYKDNKGNAFFIENSGNIYLFSEKVAPFSRYNGQFQLTPSVVIPSATPTQINAIRYYGHAVCIASYNTSSANSSQKSIELFQDDLQNLISVVSSGNSNNGTTKICIFPDINDDIYKPGDLSGLNKLVFSWGSTQHRVTDSPLCVTKADLNFGENSRQKAFVNFRVQIKDSAPTYYRYASAPVRSLDYITTPPVW